LQLEARRGRRPGDLPFSAPSGAASLKLLRRLLP